MATKLDKHSAFLKLLLRSPDEGEGWRQVSGMLTRLAEEQVANGPELYETKTVDGIFYLRLSERGKVVVDYL